MNSIQINNSNLLSTLIRTRKEIQENRIIKSDCNHAEKISKRHNQGHIMHPRLFQITDDKDINRSGRGQSKKHKENQHRVFNKSLALEVKNHRASNQRHNDQFH